MFDSGVGGLGVLREIRSLMPQVDLIYLADRGRAPYGPRPVAQVRYFSEQITELLLGRGAGSIVIACNSASAVALNHLRSIHPTVNFVGMEPAIKPAVAATKTGVIGVLATAATFQGELFASLIDRYGEKAAVVTRVCDGWVELVESGLVDGPEVDAAVMHHLEPVLDQGADTLVLGCTHYPFLGQAIRKAAGPDVQVIDPAPAVARRTAGQVGSEGDGTTSVLATGLPQQAATLIRMLAGLEFDVEAVTFGNDD